jgi:hypothetical protein
MSFCASILRPFFRFLLPLPPGALLRILLLLLLVLMLLLRVPL